MPNSVEAVSQIMAICNASHTQVVPQGGNTGLAGGQIPTGEVLLSLKRMDRVRGVDALNNTMTLEAGVTLARAQAVAAEAGRLFPLSLASEGSAMIGGVISTNAGGTQVLRYGNARALVLGLEAVLPDGRIWEGLRSLRKDNTGYDLKQLFIGAEGTLGVITAAVLALYPRPRQLETAFVALKDPAAAIELLTRLQGETGGAVTAYELMPALGLDFVTRHIPGTRAPLAQRHAWSVLIEVSSFAQDLSARAALERTLSSASDEGMVLDAAIAESEAQRAGIWRLREAMSEAQKFEGGSLKHDISVPVRAIPAFLAEASAAVEAAIPGVRVVAFGHAGDGNVHFNLSQPVGLAREAFLAEGPRIGRIVHDIAHALGGSISAEHGLGQMKAGEILRYKSAVAMDMMRAVKRALDPHGIMNPGKVLAP
ncbi:MAG: FAD-binding oxidoreductase [Alphaproteobacteria bacterium]|nr:FAD-binding oxidoreductase [Alphaproteobacteria bacterium]